LKVAAHCGTDAGARNAAMAGVASIEHGSRMSDETLELAKKNNVVLVGTDFNYHYWLEYGFTEEIARRVYDRGLDRIRRADRIGTPMAFGADIIYDSSGKSRGELSLSLIESYLDAGLSSKSILQMLTINAARLLGVDNDRGAIKPGLAADLIATPENPLDNIQSLKQVRFVMKEGKVFKKNQMMY
jgi:imidazolonepropionase-like amidohydrolase